MDPKQTPGDSDWDPFGQPAGGDRAARALSRVGVIDVGSNSVRMVVFDGAARSPAYFYNEKVMAGLGQGLAETGQLNPRGRKRALAALRRFALIAEGMKVGTVTCVATAAVREASDGPAFRRQVENETGLKLWVIDGEEEARLSAQGVLLGWPEASGLVCDIGGNSMELAVLGDGAVGARVTSPLGPFRLQQVPGGMAGIDAHIAAVIDDLADRIGGGHERIYLVGGSWRAIARLDMERQRYPMTVLHEYRMDPGELEKTLDWIDVTDPSDLRGGTGISAQRIELVPLAARVLRALVRRFAPQEICVSAYGIREGMLYERMPAKLRRRDPLLEACRHAERMMARMPGFGKKLYAFILPLFGDLPPDEARLMKAACLLHDTSWRAHPDYRAQACFDSATRANLAALSHPQRVFLGLALLHRYRNSRAGSPMEAMFSLLDDDQLRRAEILGRAMRFGAMFAVAEPETAGALRLLPQKKKPVLELTLTKRGAGLFGEVAESRFQSLATALDAETKVILPRAARKG